MDFWFPNVRTDLNNLAQYEEDNQHDVGDLTGHDEQITGNAPLSRYNVRPSADLGVFDTGHYRVTILVGRMRFSQHQA
jgi:hypothetical protein